MSGRGVSVATHGGAASARAHRDGCELAAQRAFEVLDDGGDALAAALAATTVLEDDVRFNAGTGSNLRLDGELVQMDAAVMTSDGRLGAVACIEAVKNPILVAAHVLASPHILLVGEGATAFARRLGFAPHDPRTETARRKLARALADLAGGGDGDFAEDAAPWREAPPGATLAELWNFAGEAPPVRPSRATGASGGHGCDTVGAVVRDASGGYCATASTGGTVFMLRGRVGDSPLVGCGLYAGEHGAVAATGVGEEIARRVLAKAVYDELGRGVPAAEAADRAVAAFPAALDVGLLVVDGSDCVARANRPMACAAETR